MTRSRVELLVRGGSFQIGTWNIASNKNLNAIVSRVAALNVDICAIQELSLDVAAGLPALFDQRSDVIAKYNWHFAPTPTAEQLGGAQPEFFGLGFLSRIPLRWTGSFQLGPQLTGAGANPESQPRILQMAVLDIEQPMLIGNTHLAATADWSLSAIRRAQAKKLADILRPCAERQPTFLCGDFNTGPASSDLADLRAALPYVHSSKEATFIGDSGRAPIDFFFSSGPVDVDIAVHSAAGLSDHNIVTATFAAGMG